MQAAGEKPLRTLILGAAGRDFHNFNVLCRGNPAYRVVAFTAQQIPHIENRLYPAALAGEGYPSGIPIYEEARLEQLIDELRVDLCIMAYSDLSHQEVMHLASRANAQGAGFLLAGAQQTMLTSSRPVVAVTASRTGAGKSPVSRAVVKLLRKAGKRVAVIRHPMPYGDLEAQRVQRFANRADLLRHLTTIEEREEYEPHLAMGSVVFAGVDYAAILAQAEAESDVIVWDGGNNDTSFLRADIYIIVVDPHRVGHELSYYPGETNLRLAQVVLISKVDTADEGAVAQIRENVRGVNSHARIVEAALPAKADDPQVLAGRRVLVIEDGPTTTHGGMRFGAASIAARALGATLIDPRPYAVGEIAETFARYPDTGPMLPAMGYGDQQIVDLEKTIDAVVAAGVEAIAVGTPADLSELLRIAVPSTRVRYELDVRGTPTLADVIAPVIRPAKRP
jgi:predicted GTPase